MRFIFLLLGCSTVALAQGPEQAKYLLNQVSVEIKKQKNLRLEFQYVLENKEEQIKQAQLFLKTKKSRSVFQKKEKQ